MKLLLTLLVLVFVFPATARSAGVPEGAQIIASVTDIIERTAPDTIQPGICVRMLIHSPAEFRGVRFDLFDPTRSRRLVRAEFPLGKLFSLKLPTSSTDALMKYKVTLEANERKLDEGVPPEKINKSPTIPRFELAKLKFHPAPLAVFE